MRRSLDIALLLAALLSCSCAFDLGGPTGEQQACEVDADCGFGSGCNLAAKTCAAYVTTPLAIEVIPQESNGNVARQELAAPAADSDGTYTLRLSQAVSIQGQVLPSDETAAIAARVTATRIPTIGGLPPVSYEVTVPKQEDTTGGLSYVIWVPVGNEYTLFAKPETTLDKEKFPAGYVPSFIVDDHLEKNVIVDGVSDSIRVTGRVRDAQGKAPASPVLVRAIEPDGWRRSTVATTCVAGDSRAACECPSSAAPDADCVGKFWIRIPDPKTYILRVDPAPVTPINGQTAPVSIPSVVCNGVNLGVLASGQSEQVLEDALMLADAPAAREYSLVVVDAQDQPVPGVDVSFETTFVIPGTDTFADCSSTYRRGATTDAEGKVELPLVPGEVNQSRIYTLRVTTPGDSSAASLVINNYDEVGANAGALPTIVLADRPSVVGAVVDANGNAVANATISAERKGEVGSRASTVTDDAGEFELRADNGTYTVTVIPPASSGLPRFSRDSLLISGSTSGLVLRVPQPRLLRGRLVGNKGTPIPEVLLQVYRLLGVNTLPSIGGPVNTVVTDSDGNFRLIIAEFGN